MHEEPRVINIEQDSDISRKTSTHDEVSEEIVSNLISQENVSFTDFKLLVEDFTDFKRFVLERMAKNEESGRGQHIMDILLQENKFLKQELQNKQILLEQLIKQSNVKQMNCNHQVQNKVNSWQTVKGVSTPSNPIEPYVNYSIPASQNRFDVLKNHDCNDVLYNGSEPRNFVRKSSKLPNESIKRNGFPIDEQPEKNFIKSQQNKYPRVVPGRSSYANITRRGKKINIFGDSIVRRMKGKEMSDELNSGRVYVKAFRGANCNQMSHYITPNLAEQNPDAVVIHVGTNDLQVRQRQFQKSNEEIAKDIINIGKQCKQFGVNDVFISGITCRKGFHLMQKVHEINDFLQDLCVLEDLHFISNSSIKEQHLWEDGLHLSDSGSIVLTNNIINSLNANL